MFVENVGRSCSYAYDGTNRFLPFSIYISYLMTFYVKNKSTGRVGPCRNEYRHIISIRFIGQKSRGERTCTIQINQYYLEQIHVGIPQKLMDSFPQSSVIRQLKQNFSFNRIDPYLADPRADKQSDQKTQSQQEDKSKNIYQEWIFKGGLYIREPQ